MKHEHAKDKNYKQEGKIVPLGVTAGIPVASTWKQAKPGLVFWDLSRIEHFEKHCGLFGFAFWATFKTKSWWQWNRFASVLCLFFLDLSFSFLFLTHWLTEISPWEDQFFIHEPWKLATPAKSKNVCWHFSLDDWWPRHRMIQWSYFWYWSDEANGELSCSPARLYSPSAYLVRIERIGFLKCISLNSRTHVLVHMCFAYSNTERRICSSCDGLENQQFY